MNEVDDGFFARWSRRKVQVREGIAPAEPPPRSVPAGPASTVAAPVVAPAQAPRPDHPPAAAAAAEPPPTLAEAAALTPASDFRRFVASGVEPEVKNAALKKLFTDPHFNTMDGLDTYIDDYGRPDPLPLATLRQMAQAKFLGLLTEDADTPPTDALPAPDENADLRLQPHDAAGRPGPEPGAGPEPGRLG